MNGALDTVTTPIFGNMSMVILVCVAIVVVALISTVVAIIYILKKDKKSWNLKIRTYVENRDENKIMLKPITIDAKRLRLQNGIIIFLLKKPIQGYNLMPQLTINTVPFEYDIIVAADGSYFSIKGVEDIDVKRKILGVEIMHPATEMDRQDLQQENIDLHKKNIMSKWKMIAKIAGIALACVLLIVALIIWGNNSLQAKKGRSRDG